MTKTDTEKKQVEKDQARGRKTAQGKKQEKKYVPGLSSQYDPCPHRVWTPEPGKRDKSQPKGVGSPWYVPVRKKKDIDKERADESKKKEEKARGKRQQGFEKRQKEKEEQEKKRKEEEKKKKERQKERDEKRKQKEKEKKRKADEKRKKQKEQREKAKQEKKTGEKEDKDKETRKPLPSYMYEPCPHRVYTPGPGEKDMADPKGIGSPWYVPVRKKEDIDKEEEEKQEKEKQKMREDLKKYQKKKEEEEKNLEEEKKKVEEEKKREDEIRRKRQEKRRKEMEKKEQKDMVFKEMGSGVRESRTDFTPELVWVMDFMKDVGEKESSKHGEKLSQKKEERGNGLGSNLLTKDFKDLIMTFVERKLGKVKSDFNMFEDEEIQKKKMLLKNMKNLPEKAKRFMTLYNAAFGVSGNGSGEGKECALEDIVVDMVTNKWIT